MRRTEQAGRRRRTLARLRWRLGSLAVGGLALAVVMLGLTGAPASASATAAAAPSSPAARRPAATATAAATRERRRRHVLPRNVPRSRVRVHDIVVIHRATRRHRRVLGRVTAIRRRRGRIVITYVRVPPDSLRPFHSSVHVKGRTRGIVLGGSSPPAALAPDSVRRLFGCTNLTGSVSFSPSAGGSIGVTWIDVWAGIIWSPEISGSISLSPGISVELSGSDFSGGCSADFGPPPVPIGEPIETPVGPLEMCFGYDAKIGASVAGSMGQSLYGYIGGSIGTDYHFGFTGAGLNPFDTISPSVGVSAGQPWTGSVWVKAGPYLAANYGTCDVGAGVSAGLSNTLSFNGTSTGWYVQNTQSIDASVDLDLLGYTYSQSVANWGLTSSRLLSGSW